MVEVTSYTLSQKDALKSFKGVFLDIRNVSFGIKLSNLLIPLQIYAGAIVYLYSTTHIPYK